MRLLIPVVLVALASPLYGQVSPRVGPACAAAVCEEGTIYTVAIDTLWRSGKSAPSSPPRVLRWVFQSPFRPLPGQASAPPVAALDNATGDMLSRVWAGAALLDSSQLVERDGHTLKPGGPLYIVSPIDWMGQDQARLQVAEYPHDINWGAQHFILVARAPNGWHVTRVETGMQN